jgi:hypothetical protein
VLRFPAPLKQWQPHCLNSIYLSTLKMFTGWNHGNEMMCREAC